ncbi:hypothetical protein MesoLj113c_39520 [Mesorhizobium sp. 113-3-9]|nr:hypothetical protein MesoLj113c_39520 [Mesorhizobium sp. 113-3-9]
MRQLSHYPDSNVSMLSNSEWFGLAAKALSWSLAFEQSLLIPDWGHFGTERQGTSKHVTPATPVRSWRGAVPMENE